MKLSVIFIIILSIIACFAYADPAKQAEKTQAIYWNSWSENEKYIFILGYINSSIDTCMMFKEKRKDKIFDAYCKTFESANSKIVYEYIFKRMNFIYAINRYEKFPMGSLLNFILITVDPNSPDKLINIIDAAIEHDISIEQQQEILRYKNTVDSLLLK